jgi:Leucine-rich repeat (LRR) protein
MKRLIIILLAITAVQLNAQKIKFKDLNLKNALIELGYDTNKNHEIEQEEVDTITILKVQKKNISSLNDLIHFKHLKVINAMTNNITDINVFYGNSVIEELYIGENKLGPKLLIKDMVNLKGVYAFRNDLQHIDFIGDFRNMKSLYLQGNIFQHLDVTNLPNLESLQLFECENLQTIDISKNTKLKQFFLLDMKVANVIWKTQDVKTIFVKKNVADIQPQHDSLKTAPTIKIKEGMIIKPN